ncbi:Enoyl-CoA hydratase [Plasmodiophora brassicae]
MAVPTLSSLELESRPSSVWIVWINRPAKQNAMPERFWPEIREAFAYLRQQRSRAVILAGRGKHFSSGIDVKGFPFANLFGTSTCVGRRGEDFIQGVKAMQDAFSELERAPFPVIAAIHGACVGAGLDLVCAADIRICSEDAVFSIKEIDLAIAADLGTLQRLPKIIGNESFVREVALTGRFFKASEARQVGLVSAVIPGNDDLLQAAVTLANKIASKSPVTVSVVKRSLIYSRDHAVQEGLDHVATMNAAALQSDDTKHALMAIAKL